MNDKEYEVLSEVIETIAADEESMATYKKEVEQSLIFIL